MGLFGGDDDRPAPVPSGMWGSPDFGKDAYFRDMNQHRRGHALGMGQSRPASMSPTVHPSPSIAKAKKSLAEMERERKARLSKDRADVQEYVNIGANLGMGFMNARTNKERNAVAQQAAVYGATKALEAGAGKLFDLFTAEDAEAGVKAAAADTTAGLLEQASKISGSDVTSGSVADAASEALDNLPGVGQVAQVGASIAGGANPVEAVADTAASAAGAAAGQALIPIPGVGAAVGAMAARMGTEKLKDVAGLNKGRMQSGMQRSGTQEPSEYGGVSKFLFS